MFINRVFSSFNHSWVSNCPLTLFQQVSLDASGKFSTILYHNSKLFPTPSDSLSSPMILGVNHYGSDPVSDVQLTMVLAEDARTECRWYNPGGKEGERDDDIDSILKLD